MIKQCSDCGQEYEAQSNRQQFCTACLIRHDKERTMRSMSARTLARIRAKAARPPLSHCHLCGSEIEAYRTRSKYCAECGHRVHSSYRARKCAEAKQTAQTVPHRRMSLQQVAAAADAAGMSYGQYVANMTVNKTAALAALSLASAWLGR